MGKARSTFIRDRYWRRVSAGLDHQEAASSLLHDIFGLTQARSARRRLCTSLERRSLMRATEWWWTRLSPSVWAGAVCGVTKSPRWSRSAFLSAVNGSTVVRRLR